MTSHSNFWPLLKLLRRTKILDNKENRPKIMGHDKSDRINSENSWETLQFPKKLEKSRAASLGKKIEIIRQPSFRWVPLKSNGKSS